MSKVYKWEIYDSMTKTVVSDGIGQEAEKKSLAYLRSVYGCHLKSRGKMVAEKFMANPSKKMKRKSTIRVKNPTMLADTLDAFKQPPLSEQLKPQEHKWLRDIQSKLRKEKELTVCEMQFLGDAMHLLMLFGMAVSVPMMLTSVGPKGGSAGAYMRANPERGHGTVRRVGRINQRGNFPVWFEGTGEGVRPVMFDGGFQNRPEMRPGQRIEFDFVDTRDGWTVVRSDFFLGLQSGAPPSTAPPPTTTVTATFNTGYITKLKGEEEGEQPFRMAFAPRGQSLVGTLPGISGLKIPEDVTDTSNENRIREGMPKILPSYGKISVSGHQDGRFFVVERIHDFEPTSEDRTVVIPLSELNYELNSVSFEKDNCKGVVNLNLPFDSHPTLNTLKQHFEGDVTVRGAFKKEGYWDRMGEHHYFVYLGNTAEWSATSIDNLKRIVRLHRETAAIHDLVEQYYASGRPVRFTEFVGGLQQILGRTPTVTEAERLLVSQRVEYEWEYIEALKDLSQRLGGEYLYIPHRREPEFVFVIRGKVILEIPITNKASYIFDLDEQKGLEQQLTDIRAVPQRSAFFANTDEGHAIARELKYVGRTIHRTVSGWIDRIKAMTEEEKPPSVENPTLLEDIDIEENPKGEADTVLARELALYASNDADIYRQWIIPAAQNLAHKKVQQKFDRALAVKGLAAGAKFVQKRYWKEYSGGHPAVMNLATKLAFGEEMYGEIEELVDDMVKEILVGARTRMGQPVQERQNTDVVQIQYVPEGY